MTLTFLPFSENSSLSHQQAQKNGLESAIKDDVPLEENIEGTVGVLHQLARDSHKGKNF
jgi:hypothetical protein